MGDYRVNLPMKQKPAELFPLKISGVNTPSAGLPGGGNRENTMSYCEM